MGKRGSTAAGGVGVGAGGGDLCAPGAPVGCLGRAKACREVRRARKSSLAEVNVGLRE